MRHIPDIELRPWSPPDYTVDANGKIVGATPGTPNNWGRWGELDQRGTANLLTPERIAAAATLVHTGKRFTLGLPMGTDQPNPGTRPPMQHLFRRTLTDHSHGDGGVHGLQTSDDIVVFALQQATQLDAFSHFGHADTLYNGYWSGVLTTGGGARRLGIHHQAGGVVGRGVLLDVARVHGVDPFETPITAEMLQSTAVSHGVQVGPGDIVLVRTGWLGTWLTQVELRRRRRQSGLHPDTIEWIAANDVAMVAADNVAVECIPTVPGQALVMPWHKAALCDLGLLVGELFDLDELAEDCASDGVYEFFFVATPLPVVNAVGSPLNPVAIK